MPGPSPLPPRDGLGPSWLRTPDPVRTSDGAADPWPTMRDWLLDRLPARAPVEAMLAAGRFVGDDGTAWTGVEPYRPRTFVWFFRDLPEESDGPVDLVVLHRDERLVVVDKPHFLATIPRGSHVVRTALVQARRMLDLPELTAAHRLDRLTAGVVVMTTEKRWRGPYARLFSERAIRKTYEAIAPWHDDLDLPRTVRSHIVKERGVLTAREVPGAEPNAQTRIDVLERFDTPAGAFARYVLEPQTGRTHQLRVHLHSLGVPIVGDPLYPAAVGCAALPDVAAHDDPASPLRLLARSVEFVDPVDGTARRFASGRELTPPAGPAGLRRVRL